MCPNLSGSDLFLLMAIVRYSCLNSAIGSIFVARRAGRTIAVSAARHNNKVALMKITGSQTLTVN